ncbi:MAG TPA: alcohol dehydrogenase catalytic domain-containing protein [Acidimicrobiales bacterium]|nr:alcohol dehydrogenase catalytic domain-containing protein [Acidimicrobiales bacterium]
MKAAVLTEDKPALEVTEIDDPVPAPGEVVLEVTACGICGSDLHIASQLADSGAVLGHEIAGTVAEIGSGVEGWSVGDAVVGRPFFGCGTCRFCRGGRADHCASFELVGMARPGGFAERTTLRADELFALPASITGTEQALVEPLAIARRALRRVALSAGEDVTILGGGPIGIAALVWARALGAGHVVVSEPDAARRQIALDLGADAAVDPADIGAYGAERAVPPTVVLECTGRPGLIDVGMQLTDVDGRIGVIGICISPDSFFPYFGIAKELDIRFSIFYGANDFTDTIDAMAAGTIDASRLVTETIDLPGLPTRFGELVTAPDGGKVVLVP